jgi:hypothetical protein
MMARKRKQRKSTATPRPPMEARELDRGTPELAKHYEMDIVVIDKVKVARLRDKRPIDKYHRLYLVDEDNGVAERYRRGIDGQQYMAADRVANNYERAQPRLSRELTPMVFDKGIDAGKYPIEIQMEAIHLHNRLMRELNHESQLIVRHVCCYGEGLNEYETGRRWRKGYGIIRLREALDELVKAFKNLREPRR